MKMMIAYYLTVLNLAHDMIEEKESVKDGVIETLCKFREVVGATWVPEKDKMWLLGNRVLTAENRNKMAVVRAEIHEHVAKDCGLEKHGELCVPDEIWEMTWLPE
jgi:hypothetical protein